MKPLSIRSGIGQAFVPAGGTGWRRWFVWLAAGMVASMLLMAAPRGAARPAPMSAEQLGLTFEDTCTPDTFRPNEWVVLVCDSRLVNEGQDPLGGISVRIGSPRGVTPDYYWMWYTINGEFVPVEGGALSFGRALGILEPGETVMSRLVGLVRMPNDGTYESELTVSVGQQDVLTQPTRLTATAEAAAPPADLEVAHWLMSEQVDGDGVASATYGTIVVNRGPGPITELKVTNRYSDPAVLVEAEPAPASEKAAFELAFWDLASFGKESLAPGEWLVVGTTYGPAPDAGCGYVMPGVVVEATVDGQERRYGARATPYRLDPDQWAMVGKCDSELMPGGWVGGPVAFGRGGEGPPGREVDALWAVAVLTAGGASLVAAALALRRRARLGRRIYW